MESARLEAQLLAAHALGVDRSFVLAHPDAEVPEDAADVLLQRRSAREPLAYIVGRREFYGRPFAVRPGVLIPRQETETLVDAALGLLPIPDTSDRQHAGAQTRVLDLGTGSGILAITLKLERPAASVTASDISPQALAVAKENANALGARVRFILSDAFAGLPGERFDLIVTNPPYVAAGATLNQEIAEHEPEVALYSGESGLEFYAMLAALAPEHLSSGGRLMVELGDGTADRVAALFEGKGWRIVGRSRDLLGIERCLTLSPASD